MATQTRMALGEQTSSEPAIAHPILPCSERPVDPAVLPPAAGGLPEGQDTHISFVSPAPVPHTQ